MPDGGGGLHAEQHYVYHRPVRAGDVLSASVREGRRWPVPVFGTAAACSLLYYGAGFSDGPGWIGLFVALYTLTAYGPGGQTVSAVLHVFVR